MSPGIDLNTRRHIDQIDIGCGLTAAFIVSGHLAHIQECPDMGNGKSLWSVFTEEVRACLADYFSPAMRFARWVRGRNK